MLQFRSSIHPGAPDLGVLLVVRTALWLGVYREVTGTSTLMFIGGFNLTTVEVILSTVGIALYLGSIRSFRPGAASVLVLCFAALYVSSLVRGLMIMPYDAITSMRGNAALPVILVWSLFVSPHSLWHERVQRTIVNVGWLLAAVVFLRLVMGPGFLMLVQGVDDVDINDGGRALTAQGAIILACATTLYLWRFMSAHLNDLAESRYRLQYFIILFAAVVLTKQGTATLAMVAATGVVFVTVPGQTRPVRAVLMVTLAIVVAGLTLGLKDSQLLN